MNQAIKKNNTPARTIRRKSTPRLSNAQYYSIAIVCCCVLVVGFFLAARQHFSSMEYGMRNSRLRKQLDELQFEKRRLLLNREVSLSPAELKKAFKRVGFFDTPMEVESPALIQKTNLRRMDTTVPNDIRRANRVLPTVLSRPVNKPEPLGKQANREGSSQKRDRT